jgi:hypothetical protein
MNKQIRHCAVGFLALALTSSYSLVAAAQMVDEDGYVVEEGYFTDEADEPVVQFDGDDDGQVLVVSPAGMQRCVETFQSFDPGTGTYVTYQGETRICPYLE